jgi:periplasmic divalent cation tolerance protein
MSQFIQVTTTTPDKETALKIAQKLVTDKLVACAQVLSSPITSIYHWENNIEQSEEYVCILKTTQQFYPAVQSAIIELHPYEVPEIIATELVAGLPQYFNWISESLQ